MTSAGFEPPPFFELAHINKGDEIPVHPRGFFYQIQIEIQVSQFREKYATQSSVGPKKGRGHNSGNSIYLSLFPQKWLMYRFIHEGYVSYLQSPMALFIPPSFLL
jgi:hypothetical protein